MGTGACIGEYRYRMPTAAIAGSATRCGSWGKDGEPASSLGLDGHHRPARDPRGAARERSALQAGVRQCPIGIALVGLDGRFLQVNREMCRFLGYEAEALVKRTTLEVTHPRTANLTMRSAPVSRRRFALPRRKRFVRADGSLVWGSSASRRDGWRASPSTSSGRSRTSPNAARRGGRRRARAASGAHREIHRHHLCGRREGSSPSHALHGGVVRLLGRPARRTRLCRLPPPDDVPRAAETQRRLKEDPVRPPASSCGSGTRTAHGGS